MAGHMPDLRCEWLRAMRVALIFSAEDRLIGYVLYIARDRETDVRTRVDALYGSPSQTVEQRRTIAWRWASGTNATLTAFCRGLDGRLIVKAKAAAENAPRP